MVNVESAHGSTMSLSDLLPFKKIDILVVMETWLGVTDECITEIFPPCSRVCYCSVAGDGWVEHSSIFASFVFSCLILLSQTLLNAILCVIVLFMIQLRKILMVQNCLAKVVTTLVVVLLGFF